MTNFSSIDKTRLCLIICLESINIDKKNKILTNTNKEFTNSKTIFSSNDLKKKVNCLIQKAYIPSKIY